MICFGMYVPYILFGLLCAYVASTIVGILPAIMLFRCCEVDLMVAIFALAPAIGSVTLLVFATVLLCISTVVAMAACLVREYLHDKNNKQTLEV